MGEKKEKASSVMINRAPVVTLWAAVVAGMLGFDYGEAVTLGRAGAGLNAYSKGIGLDLRPLRTHWEPSWLPASPR